MISTVQLLEALITVDMLWPNAELAKNGIGNLSVLVRGEYVGWIDLGDGTVGKVGDDS